VTVSINTPSHFAYQKWWCWRYKYRSKALWRVHSRNESGNPHLCVDEALRRRLETKLITKILTFNVA